MIENVDDVVLEVAAVEAIEVKSRVRWDSIH
jgi:hypothetical protein